MCRSLSLRNGPRRADSGGDEGCSQAVTLPCPAAGGRCSDLCSSRPENTILSRDVPAPAACFVASGAAKPCSKRAARCPRCRCRCLVFLLLASCGRSVICGVPLVLAPRDHVGLATAPAPASTHAFGSAVDAVGPGACGEPFGRRAGRVRVPTPGEGSGIRRPAPTEAPRRPLTFPRQPAHLRSLGRLGRSQDCLAGPRPLLLVAAPRCRSSIAKRGVWRYEHCVCRMPHIGPDVHLPSIACGCSCSLIGATGVTVANVERRVVAGGSGPAQAGISQRLWRKREMVRSVTLRARGESGWSEWSRGGSRRSVGGSRAVSTRSARGSGSAGIAGRPTGHHRGVARGHVMRLTV